VNQQAWATPDLQTLVDLFYTDRTRLGVFSAVSAAELPDSDRKLLAHHSHMTVAVEKFFGCPVDVQVLEEKQTATHYSRKILLRRHDNQTVVQFGLVRLSYAVVNQEVRQEIESRSAPLGRILIQHKVLRKVRLLELWRIHAGVELQQYFDRAAPFVCYGRTALIYCDGLPAVELLEIVNVPDSPSITESSARTPTA
jgi:hypothetical protein